MPPIAAPWPLVTEAEIKAGMYDRPPAHPETITDSRRKPLR
jgi:hypothetical protein